MHNHSQRIAGRIVTALLAVAPLSAAWSDPASKPAESSSAAAQAAHPARGANNAAPAKPLDLRTPALNRVFRRSDLEALESRPDDVSEGAETVAVEGTIHDRVVAPSGLRGLAWGVRHPTQAWRLFVPSPSD
jgi:hypothetical protein